MSKRVTIMISEDLDKKVREKQAKMIRSLTSTVSYSRVINEVLAGKIKL